MINNNFLNRPPHLAVAYKKFSNVCHAGLGVSAVNSVKVLRDADIPCEAWPISVSKDLVDRITAVEETLTHVVVSAPWISTADWWQITQRFPWIQFLVNSHSNVGFLQADPNAIRLLREGADLEAGTPNFRIAANCETLATWINKAYCIPCVLLPNMYWCNGMTRVARPLFTAGTLKIGCFGASRPLKNHTSAAAAALEIAQDLRVDMEFWISGGRAEGGNTMLSALDQMFANLRYATLRRANWETWPEFRRTVASMHLLMQPSYTESFNMVTADGIAEGVPSVVSSAIEWVPNHFHADADDAGDIARVGKSLLRDGNAPAQGLVALERYNRESVQAWRRMIAPAHSR